MKREDGQKAEGSKQKAASRVMRCLLPTAFCLLFSGLCFPAPAQKVVDQILMLVNDEVITRTDLLWSLALDPETPSPAGPVSSDMLKRKLDVMIDERLIAQEAARIPAAEITQDDISKKRSELISRFPSEAVFRERVMSVGLTPARIDELLRQRVAVDRFIEFRFRSFVFVSEQELQRYYDERLAPEIRQAGQVPPPLDQVRERIGQVLKEEKINEEIDRFLTAARQRADIMLLAEP
jgi:hypothetical protein